MTASSSSNSNKEVLRRLISIPGYLVAIAIWLATPLLIWPKGADAIALSPIPYSAWVIRPSILLLICTVGPFIGAFLFLVARPGKFGWFLLGTGTAISILTSVGLDWMKVFNPLQSIPPVWIIIGAIATLVAAYWVGKSLGHH